MTIKYDTKYTTNDTMMGGIPPAVATATAAATTADFELQDVCLHDDPEIAVATAFPVTAAPSSPINPQYQYQQQQQQQPRNQQQQYPQSHPNVIVTGTAPGAAAAATSTTTPGLVQVGSSPPQQAVLPVTAVSPYEYEKQMEARRKRYCMYRGVASLLFLVPLVIFISIWVSTSRNF